MLFEEKEELTYKLKIYQNYIIQNKYIGVDCLF